MPKTAKAPLITQKKADWLRDHIASHRWQLQEWERTGCCEGRRVDGHWLARERRSIAEQMATLKEWDAHLVSARDAGACRSHKVKGGE